MRSFRDALASLDQRSWAALVCVGGGVGLVSGAASAVSGNALQAGFTLPATVVSALVASALHSPTRSRLRVVAVASCVAFLAAIAVHAGLLVVHITHVHRDGSPIEMAPDLMWLVLQAVVAIIGCESVRRLTTETTTRRGKAHDGASDLQVLRWGE